MPGQTRSLRAFATPSAEETAFQRWYARLAQRWDLNPNPDDPEQFYDYRAAYKAGAKPDPASGHWPSEFKRGGHPNLIVGGFHTQTGERVPGAPLAKSAADLVQLGWDAETAQQLWASVDPAQEIEEARRVPTARDAVMEVLQRFGLLPSIFGVR